jgi:hypothetical protein
MSAFLTLATLRDEGAVEVAKEALAEAGIPVEIRRTGGNAYFGSATATEVELRVPEDKMLDAEAVMARLSHESEQAALAEAGVPPDPNEDGPAVEPRRRISWALALSLLLPFPGGGCMYARAFRTGLVLAGVFVGLVLAGVAGVRVEHGTEVWIGTKLVDLVLAPLFVVRWNRRISDGGNHAHA